MTDIYQIKDTDTVSDLTSKFDTSIEEILKVNNLNSTDELVPGLKIVIPQRNDEYYSIYTVSKGDSLYQIAKSYNIHPELLAALNGLNFDDYIYPNQELLIPKNNYSYYLTAEGDTLNTVKEMFKTSIDKIIDENATIYLMPGQLIVNKK